MSKGMKKWLIGLGLLVALLLAVGIGVALSRKPSNPVQPVAFSHKIHAGELKLPCIMCHQSAGSQTFAGLPQTEMCMACHTAALTQNPEEKKIRQYATKGDKIPWQRIYQMPGYVFFSHRRHVALGKVECSTCHGNMAEQRTPPTQPLVNQTMAWCIDCHQERRASVDCNACHK